MPKSKILVVEDNKIISLEIKQRLESMGYEVVAVAYAGEEAITKATEKLPDLVLMDIKLSGKMDGIEAAEKIRVLLDIPVVYLTAYSDESTLQRAKVTEPFGYIVKPLEERELHSTIEISLYKHKIEKKLKESESKYHSIVESFDGFIYINDSDYNIKFLNNKLIKKIGRNAIDEKCHKVLYGLDTPCQWCEMDIILRENIVRSERYNTFDNTWYEEVHTSVRDRDGKIMKQSMMRDISERKKDEEKIIESLREKEVMLSEIHHRVKNNLQIISSLLNLQSTYIIDKAALNAIKESRNRVSSMALIHEKLYKSKNLSKIDFEDYIKHLTSHLLQIYAISKVKVDMKINASQVFLTVDTAIPTGLIINELVSNSLKHAFPDKKEGKIEIELKQTSQGEYYLKVKDNGCGIKKDVNLSSTTTLGMQLISMLTKQLAGEVKIENGTGTEVTIKFKEANYKERLKEKNTI